jgi:hypothetical protein
VKAAYAPVMAVIMITAFGASCAPVWSQLPPTNMGKFVHQPGDNQYSDVTQQTRHGAPPQAAAPQFRAAPAVSPGYSPTPAARKPDITLEPISAAEPVPPAGFPPLPDRLDLPLASSGGSSWNASRGYSAGGGGAAPGMSSGGAPNATFHQHYGHVPPGAYLKNQSGGSSGYYRARSPGGDFYNAGSASGSDAERQLRSLGREPRINAEQAAAPEAPTPVVVSQSTTQDLSLPDDEFTTRQLNRKSGTGKAIGRAIRRPLNRFGGLAGVRF